MIPHIFLCLTLQTILLSSVIAQSSGRPGGGNGSIPTLERAGFGNDSLHHMMGGNSTSNEGRDSKNVTLPNKSRPGKNDSSHIESPSSVYPSPVPTDIASSIIDASTTDSATAAEATPSTILSRIKMLFRTRRTLHDGDMSKGGRDGGTFGSKNSSYGGSRGAGEDLSTGQNRNGSHSRHHHDDGKHRGNGTGHPGSSDASSDSEFTTSSIYDASADNSGSATSSIYDASADLSSATATSIYGASATDASATDSSGSTATDVTRKTKMRARQRRALQERRLAVGQQKPTPTPQKISKRATCG